MKVESDTLLFERSDKVTLGWNPESILPLLEPNEYTVDVFLLELDSNTGKHKQLSMLGSNLPNNGSTEVVVDYINSSGEGVEESINMAVIEVSVNPTSMSGNIPTGRSRRSASILSALGRSSLRVVRYSPVRYVLATWAIQRSLCEAWSAFQPDNIGEMILNRLTECPRTTNEAAAPNSGLKEDNFAIHFFHPNASKCFRQRVTDRYIKCMYRT